LIPKSEPKVHLSDGRVLIANAVADSARAAFREDVRQRKMAIAIGAGNVHGHSFVLSEWGLKETQADTLRQAVA
jgi:hypothetical protein